MSVWNIEPHVHFGFLDETRILRIAFFVPYLFSRPNISSPKPTHLWMKWKSIMSSEILHGVSNYKSYLTDSSRGRSHILTKWGMEGSERSSPGGLFLTKSSSTWSNNTVCISAEIWVWGIQRRVSLLSDFI